MSAIGLFALIVLIAYGVGRRFGVSDADQLAEFVKAAALGLGAIGYLILALGLAGQLSLWPLVGLLAVCGAAGGREAIRLLGRIPGRLSGWRPGPASLALGGFLALMGGLTLAGALAPATTNDWDGLSYHLAVPKLYLQAGRIHYIPWMSHSNFPFTWEMLYSLGLGLDGQALAKLFNWGAAALIALALIAIGRRHWNQRVGLVAAAAFAAVPLAGWEAPLAGNDLAFALYSLLAIWALLDWTSLRVVDIRQREASTTAHRVVTERDHPPGLLALAGAFCGLALGSKALAGSVLIFLLLALLWHAASARMAAGRAAKSALLLLAVALAVASPWYLKSYLWTGNPVYPFAYELFGGRYWSLSAAREYRAEQLSYGMGRGPLSVIALPWNLLVHPNRFFNLPERPRPFHIFTSLGPLFLAFLPLLIFVRGRPLAPSVHPACPERSRRGRSRKGAEGKARDEVGSRERGDPALRYLLWYGLIFTLAWFFSSQHARYLLAALAPFSLAVAVARERTDDLGVPARAGAWSVLGVAMAAALVLGYLGNAAALPVALGAQSRDSYLRETTDIYPAAVWANEKNLPPGSKLIFFGETRGFYFDVPYLWANHHHEMIEYGQMRSAGQMLAAFRRLGVTHALATRQFLDSIGAGDAPLSRLFLQALKEGKLEPVFQGYGKVIYRIGG